ncbi:MAG: tRNA (adenine-N1)-methyltransferase [Candidatus Korarchaeota archaeon]
MIKENDHVLLVDTKGHKWLVKVSNREFHTHAGRIDLGILIGKPYGTIIEVNGRVIFALKPTYFDYIMKFKRKTQIIYPKDLAIIVTHANIAPGSRVIECGTGSGALTATLAIYVGNTGKVYSYDIDPEVQEIAKDNISTIDPALLERVEFKKYEGKFYETEVDAVMLDLPTPWDFIEQAFTSLRDSGILVTLLPNYNQVEKTVVSMIPHFYHEKTIEVIIRGYKIREGASRPEDRMIAHTAFVTFARKLHPLERISTKKD